MAACPGHRDHTPSLAVSEATNGTVLVKCFAGCSQETVISALKDRGLWPNSRGEGWIGRQGRAPWRVASVGDAGALERIRAAREIWRKTVPPQGTLVETYLRSRGITIIPPSIRYAADLRHGPTGLTRPALVAAIQAPDGSVTGVLRIFMTANGRAKARVIQAKMMLGRISGGAVRLAPMARRLGLAEGIENGLSIAQALPDLPVWCALSVGNIGNVVLPPLIREVVLFVDGDPSGSQAAETAQKAADWITSQGRHVSIASPGEGRDFNKLLVRGAV